MPDGGMPIFTPSSSRRPLSSPWLSAALAAALLAGAPAYADNPTAPPAQAQAPAKKLNVSGAKAEATGATVTIEGTVTVAPGTFTSAMEDQGFGVQDSSGGVYVKMTEKQSFGVGSQVRVTGVLDEQNKLRILKAEPSGVTVLKGTKKLTPKKVGTGAVNESVEGQLLQVTGKVTKTFQDDSPYGYKLYIDDGSGEIQIFVHVSAGFDKAALQALAAGQKIQVVGFGAQYETTYEVAPRSPADLVTQ
jgi:DNA/RNA endonuclease YhcR with UshA esterase domain